MLTLAPYLSGGVLLLCGGLLSPVGWQLIFISAIAAGFCGPIGFVFIPTALPRKAEPSSPPGTQPAGRAGPPALR